jgi:hypothetical protein
MASLNATIIGTFEMFEQGTQLCRGQNVSETKRGRNADDCLIEHSLTGVGMFTTSLRTMLGSE